jgi:hypothetical protein
MDEKWRIRLGSSVVGRGPVSQDATRGRRRATQDIRRATFEATQVINNNSVNELKNGNRLYKIFPEFFGFFTKKSINLENAEVFTGVGWIVTLDNCGG